MKYLFDTNVIIGFFKGDTELVRRMESLSVLHISVITRGELLFGALNSSNPDRNRATYLEFFKSCDIINISEKTADYYAEIRHALKSKGQPIPENDIWIAA